MQVRIDNDIIHYVADDGSERTCGIGTAEGFAILSRLWLRSGWDIKYVYGFSWMGRPIIQLPEDMIRIQELIYAVKPDVVIETGVAHGGSLVFYASLLHAMGKGRVIGVDIDIREHNRVAIERHETSFLIDLVQGSSIAPDVLQTVAEKVHQDEQCLVLLDSNHSREHVLQELRCYSQFVKQGSFIVACDGIMQDVVGAPRTKPEWLHDNPQTAVREFLAEQDNFELLEPAFTFNEGLTSHRVTYWPNAFLRRIR